MNSGTQIPHFIARNWLVSKAIVPLAPYHRPDDFGVYITYGSRTHLPARARVFIDFLSEEISSQGETSVSTWAENLA